ncbi:YihY/virulence factor BrkB family protein [Microlunatus panaciterrae]|uniref:Membrane protein n=1 Tax=Microlunatus panaciterrae TaxID=400768 RepID=A0ABS2RFX8_9ACTN|nr:YihY/virulence factor BrkB family protein [Microlunatus panaciterrae]MBM7797648.1 membrane protein [Microlunatus panaciterrae]
MAAEETLTKSSHPKTSNSKAGPGDVPGGQAEKPSQIPARGWLQVVKRGWREAKSDQVPLLAAGVAFYGFLSLFPAMIALVLVVGLVADPATIADKVGSLMSAMPGPARDLVTQQLQSLTSSGQQSLGIGLVVSILLAFWSASGGVSNLVTAINAAYDENEDRGFVKKRALALGLTVAAIVFMTVMIILVAVVPAVLENLVGGGPLRWLLEAARWLLLLVCVVVALAVLYRVSPDRDAPKMRWVSTGAVAAAVLWLIASVGFSVYVSSFGNYAKTYGAFAGVIILLLWLWITSYAVLLGAEINAESEEQTVADTTRGAPEPLGQRGAVKADSTPVDER